MTVYICFHIFRNQKTVSLVFVNREKAFEFMESHHEYYMERWEAIE